MLWTGRHSDGCLNMENETGVLAEMTRLVTSSEGHDRARSASDHFLGFPGSAQDFQKTKNPRKPIADAGFGNSGDCPKLSNGARAGIEPARLAAGDFESPPVNGKTYKCLFYKDKNISIYTTNARIPTKPQFSYKLCGKFCGIWPSSSVHERQLR